MNASSEPKPFECLGVLELEELSLESGRILRRAPQAYARYGELNAAGDNAVLVCHALTGSHRLAGEELAGLPRPWWNPLVGEHKALDTANFCVICVNVLASPYGSASPLSLDPATGQPYRMTFPLITVRDMVRAQRATLERLGVRHLRAVVGGSLGAMQALEWLATYPDFVDGGVFLAGPLALYPQAIAFNEVQRRAIQADPDWREGNYPPGGGPHKGLAVARMMATITYRSEQSFVGRWKREMAGGDPLGWDGTFQVESYLHHQGEALVRRFDANCYLYLTRAMDLHDVQDRRTDDELRRAFGGKPVLGVGISSDLLFPNWQVQEAVRALGRWGADAAYDEIESDHGHDAFLIHADQVDEMVRNFFSHLLP